MHTEQVLALSNIEVFDVSAQQNALIIGVPSPATFCGVSLKLCRDAGIGYVSTAAIIHAFDFNEGHAKFVPHEANQSAASTTDVITGNLTVSLLIKVTRENYGADIDLLLEQSVRRNLRRIGGGRVIDAQSPRFALYGDEEEALRNSKGLSGSVLVDRSDLITDAVHENIADDPLGAIFHHIAIPAEGVHKKGWLVPIHVGFQAVGAPSTTRSADRRRQGDNLPHVFGECISSLGQYTSIRRIRSLRDCFWAYRHNPAEGTYSVAAR